MSNRYYAIAMPRFVGGALMAGPVPSLLWPAGAATAARMSKAWTSGQRVGRRLGDVVTNSWTISLVMGIAAVVGTPREGQAATFTYAQVYSNIQQTRLFGFIPPALYIPPVYDEQEVLGGLVAAVNSRATNNLSDASASGSASLITGQLKASSTVAKMEGQRTDVQSSALAFMVERFSHTNLAGSPFQWDGRTARFDITLDGLIGDPRPVNLAWAKFGIAIYDASLTDVVPTMPTAFRDAFLPGLSGGAGRSSFIKGAEVALGTPGSTPSFGIGGLSGSQPVLTTLLDYTQGPVDLDFEFTPEGDFVMVSWLQASASGQTYATYGGVYYPGPFVADFGNTVNLRYEAPEGAIATSASGVFPGTVTPVPLPAAVWLFGSAIAGVAALRCRAC